MFIIFVDECIYSHFQYKSERGQGVVTGVIACINLDIMQAADLPLFRSRSLQSRILKYHVWKFKRNIDIQTTYDYLLRVYLENL